MKKFKKVLTILLLLMGINLLLSGCERIYTESGQIKYAEKKLSDKYGEEFKVTEVFRTNGKFYEVYAYSVNHPDVIFEANVTWSDGGYSRYDSDFYIEELVAEKYKALVDEKIAGLGYDYYIDCWCANIDTDRDPILDTSMTIEEYEALSEHEPDFNIYFDNEILSEDNETLYALLKDMTSVTDCLFGFYVVTEEDLEKVREEYSKRSVRSPEFFDYLEERYCLLPHGEEKAKCFGFASTDGEWNRTEEDFYETMEEIRNNELFQ